MKKFFGKEKIGRAVLLYTTMFAFCILAVTFLFYRQHRSFLWSHDGLSQHFVTLNYFRNTIITFFKTGNFNTFSWNIGLGMDLFGNLAYYIIGDFFSYLSILLPANKMEFLYSFLVPLRWFFVGISFIIYSKYKNKSNFASAVGSIMYTFCVFILLAAVRHPYFINAFILFPLLMLGMEKIVNDNKKIFYIIIIFITYLSSFYFAYMLSLCLLIYGSILIISKYYKYGFKIVMMEFFKVFLYTLIGIALSSVVLIPTIYQFINSMRSNSDITYIYNSNYYTNLLYSFTSFASSNWVVLGINALAMLTLPLAFKNFKENKKILIFLLILLIPLLVVQVGVIFSGFSYPNNRWSFVLLFIFSFLTTSVLDKYKDLKKEDLKWIIGFNLIYFSLIYLFVNEINSVTYFLIIVFISYIFIFLNKQFLEMFSKRYHFFEKINLFKIGICSLVVISTCAQIYLYYSNDNYSYLKEFVEYGETAKINETNNYHGSKYAEKIQKLKTSDQDFYRIDRMKDRATYNSGLYLDFKQIGFYYSIIPRKLGELGYDLSNMNYLTSHELLEIDYRTKITTLLGNKYYIFNNDIRVPYGYSLIDYDKDTLVYKNDYSVPFATYYDSYIDLDEYNELESIEKESSLLKSVALKKEDVNTNYLKKNENILKELDKNIKYLDFSLSNDNKKIEVTNTSKDKGDNILYIDIKPKDLEGELYLSIKNINYEPQPKKELNSNSALLARNPISPKNFTVKVNYKKINTSKQFGDLQYDPYTTGDSNILVNLHNYEEIDGQIAVELSEIGTYTYDDISIILVKFNDYEEDITNLNKSNFELEDLDSGYLKGTVDLEKNGLIQFSTAYVEGWDIYIDGKKSNPLNVNKYFLGIYVPGGGHTIELKYHTPYLKMGKIISLIGLMSFIVVVCFEKRENVKHAKKKK